MPGRPAPMTAHDQTRLATRLGPSVRRRLRPALRALALQLGPYVRQRAREADAAAVLGRLQAEVEHLGTRHSEQIERLEDLAGELIATAEALRRRISDADALAGGARASVDALATELHALPYLAGSPFESMKSSVGEVLGYRSRASVLNGEAGYVAFEELFRGPMERVAASQRPYLALVREHQPILDVGCGRGEFLELAAAEGIAAGGVDLDPGMVERCRARGLDVVLGEAADQLEGLPDGALGTVFCAQVIEHLPVEEVWRLLDLARRKLRPGGLFIAETVNPDRISSLKTFWVDLSHRHPIFPEVALAAAAIAGFESAYVFAPTFEDFERSRHDAPAYAVVATAPAADELPVEAVEEPPGDGPRGADEEPEG
jgi:SAM-dependent methyltransferase